MALEQSRGIKLTEKAYKQLRCYSCLNSIRRGDTFYKCELTNTVYCEKHRAKGWSSHCNIHDHQHIKIDTIQIKEAD